VSKPTAAELQEAFRVALGAKKVASVQPRLIALGHEAVCSRCGGCGNFSYCQMYGTTCFKCGGSGKTATKLTPALLEQIKAQVAAGELEPYLAKLRREAEHNAYFKAWRAKALAAWEGQPGYEHCHFTQQSCRMSALNNVASRLLDQAQKVEDLVRHGIFVPSRAGSRQGHRRKLSEGQKYRARLRLEWILRQIERCAEIAEKHGLVEHYEAWEAFDKATPNTVVENYSKRDAAYREWAAKLAKFDPLREEWSDA
jgi:hypothetical protein